MSEWFDSRSIDKINIIFFRSKIWKIFLEKVGEFCPILQLVKQVKQSCDNVIQKLQNVDRKILQ